MFGCTDELDLNLALEKLFGQWHEFLIMAVLNLIPHTKPVYFWILLTAYDAFQLVDLYPIHMLYQYRVAILKVVLLLYVSAWVKFT